MNVKNKENINLLTIIPALLIVLLVFSGRFKIPFISTISSSPIYVGMIFIIIMVGIIFVYKETSIYKDSIGFIFLNFIFLIYLTTRSFNNSGLQYNLKLFEITLYVFPLVVFIFLFIKSKKDIKNVIFCIYLISLLFGLIGLANLNSDVSRLSIFGGGSNVYGRYMVFGFTLSFYYLISLPQKYIKFLIVFFMMMFLILIIQTGSRQAFFGVCLAVAFFTISFGLVAIKNKKFKIKNVIYISLFFILAYNLFVKYAADTLFWNRINLLFAENKGDSVNARFLMIDKAKQMFVEAPFLGKGTGGFQKEMSAVHSYPHNLIYELLSEYGVVGFGLFSLIILYVIIKGFNTITFHMKHKLNIIAVIALLNMFVLSIYFSLISGDIYDSRWIWFYGTLIVAYSIIRREVKVNE